MSDQGRNANRHGGENENDIESALIRHGFEFVDLRHLSGLGAIEALRLDLRDGRLFSRPEGVFSRQVNICTSIHGTRTYADWVLLRDGWPSPLGLEAKHQYLEGSADQKTEFLFANITERFPCPCIVILEGPAFSDGVYRRALEWVDKSGGLVVAVYRSVGDFRRWLTNGAEFPKNAVAPGLFK